MRLTGENFVDLLREDGFLSVKFLGSHGKV
jgi:predicted RNA binding protein YcfA (HicA-like mRNA interferase family)